MDFWENKLSSLNRSFHGGLPEGRVALLPCSLRAGRGKKLSVGDYGAWRLHRVTTPSELTWSV